MSPPPPLNVYVNFRNERGELLTIGGYNLFPPSALSEGVNFVPAKYFVQHNPCTISTDCLRVENLIEDFEEGVDENYYLLGKAELLVGAPQKQRTFYIIARYKDQKPALEIVAPASDKLKEKLRKRLQPSRLNVTSSGFLPKVALNDGISMLFLSRAQQITGQAKSGPKSSSTSSRPGIEWWTSLRGSIESKAVVRLDPAALSMLKKFLSSSLLPGEDENDSTFAQRSSASGKRKEAVLDARTLKFGKLAPASQIHLDRVRYESILSAEEGVGKFLLRSDLLVKALSALQAEIGESDGKKELISMALGLLMFLPSVKIGNQQPEMRGLDGVSVSPDIDEVG